MSSKFVECHSAASVNTDVPSHRELVHLVMIIDEMVDRNQRKNNIVVYNFPESADRNADIDSFKTLSDTVFKLDLDVTKVTSKRCYPAV